MILLIVAAAIVAVFGTYMILLAPGCLPKGADRVLWNSAYAHRGLHNKDRSVPENSLAAFSAAAAAGYGIELDINLTTDGKVVVFHDDTLLRVCGIDKAVSACTYAELKLCRLHNTDEGIPLFSEVLALIGGRVPIIVELKNTADKETLCKKTAELLDAYTGPYCIESFHPGIVLWFKKNRPAVIRGQLSAGKKNFTSIPAYQGALMASLITNVLTRPHFVAFYHPDAHGRLSLYIYRMFGGKLVGWTVRDTDDVKACISFFDAIIFEFFMPEIKKG